MTPPHPPAWGLTVNPFVGPRPFTTEDAPKFGGRASESARVAELWRTRRVTVLHGPPGVGKTSLLLAGVVPALRERGVRILPIARPGVEPDLPRALLADYNPFTFELVSSWEPRTPLAGRCGLSIAEFLRLCARGERPGPVLAAIDQADRFFSRGDRLERHRHRFVAELLAALVANPETRLLLVVRRNVMAESALFEAALGPGQVAFFRLDPLVPEAAAAAAWRPIAVGAGRLRPDERPPDFVRLLMAELSAGATASVPVTPMVDPTLLQVVCARLGLGPWHGAADPSRRVRELVDRILNEFCTRTLAAVAGEHALPPRRVAGWLSTAVTEPIGMLRSGASGGAFPEPDVMHALVDRHLVRPAPHAAEVFEVQHPRLVRPARRVGLVETAPDPAACLAAARAALASGNTESARRLARRAAVRCGERASRMLAEVETLLGDIAHEERRSEQAVEHYAEAARQFALLSGEEAVARLYGALGRLALRAGDTLRALDYLTAASERMRGDLTFDVSRAQALWYADRVQDARSLLGDVLRRGQPVPEARRLLGEINADDGSAEDALRDLYRVNAFAPVAARAARALARTRLRGWEASPEELAELEREAPADGLVLLRLARTHLLRGTRSVALELVVRALAAKDPPLSQFHKRIGRELLHDLLHEL